VYWLISPAWSSMLYICFWRKKCPYKLAEGSISVSHLSSPGVPCWCVELESHLGGLGVTCHYSCDRRWDPQSWGWSSWGEETALHSWPGPSSHSVQYFHSSRLTYTHTTLEPLVSCPLPLAIFLSLHPTLSSEL
jgi:hypothetical protein